MYFSWKKHKILAVFLNNSKNLRLGEKQITKQTDKQKPFLELNILYMIKVTIKISRDHFQVIWFEKLPKTLQIGK